MRLESERRVVELSPLRYQFANRVAAGETWDWDANWLVVSGAVRDHDLSWTFTEPCLTTREARELLGWLRGLVQDEPGADSMLPDAFRFVEPNIHFELRQRVGRFVSITVWFAQESPPPRASDEVRFGDGQGVNLHIPIDDIKSAADEWERELQPFPER